MTMMRAHYQTLRTPSHTPPTDTTSSLAKNMQAVKKTIQRKSTLTMTLRGVLRNAFWGCLCFSLGRQSTMTMTLDDSMTNMNLNYLNLNYTMADAYNSLSSLVSTNIDNDEEYSLASLHSYGLINDTTNADWKTLQHHTTHTSWYEDAQNPLLNIDNATEWNLRNMIPNFDCPRTVRMGKAKRGESKYVCHPERLTYPQKQSNSTSNCLIYSFGCAGDYSWEDSLVAMHPHMECEIHVFDPAPSFVRQGDVEQKNIHYHAWGLRSTYDLEAKSVVWPKGRGGGFKTFPETLELLGHEDRIIDILKIDCEGCEWSTIKDWIGLGIRQILIETHGVPSPNGTPKARWFKKPMDVAKEWYQHYIQHGYALFHKEINGGLSLELCFIKLHPDFWDTTKTEQTDQQLPGDSKQSSSTLTPPPSSWADDVRLLTELTTRNNKTLDCPSPLIPFHNRIVPPTTTGDNNENPVIPRFLHMTERSRCVSPDLYHALQVWQKHFPSFSIFFHDDEAVDKLLAMDWPEFPDFHRMLKCVLKGAMKIDIWRVLVLWKFGGMYADNDVLPSSILTESFMHPQATFFSLSDAGGRTSQWLFASTPRHQVNQNAIARITFNVLSLPNIAKPRVLYTTGPMPFYLAGWKSVFVNATHFSEREDLLRSPEGLLVQRVFGSADDYLNNSYWNDTVPCRANCSGYDIITRKERNQLDAGRRHWIHSRAKNSGLPSMPCAKYLEYLEQGAKA